MLVSRAERRPRADFWPIGLRNALPTVQVPLRVGDGDAHLDLRAILDRVYDQSGYLFYLIQREPDPPLAGDDAFWARSLIPPRPEATRVQEPISTIEYRTAPDPLPAFSRKRCEA